MRISIAAESPCLLLATSCAMTVSSCSDMRAERFHRTERGVLSETAGAADDCSRSRASAAHWRRPGCATAGRAITQLSNVRQFAGTLSRAPLRFAQPDARLQKSCGPQCRRCGKILYLSGGRNPRFTAGARTPVWAGRLAHHASLKDAIERLLQHVVADETVRTYQVESTTSAAQFKQAEASDLFSRTFVA